MKHGWNSLVHYLEIHETILRTYEKYMESPRIYNKNWLNELHLFLSCTRIIVTTYRGSRIRIDIEKDVEVDDSIPGRLRAKTFGYKYSANRPGEPSLIRYCSPHWDANPEKAPDHHRYHHKHDFTRGKEIITKTGNDWPHVGEFFEEVLKNF